jgi:hypothetical protein
MKSNVFLKVVAAGAVVAILTAGRSGCVANLEGVSCNFKVNNPHESNGTPGYIDAKATVSCDGEVDWLSGTVKLQRLIGPKWVDVPKTLKSRSVPNPRPNKPITIQTADFKCKKGIFRAAARGAGSRAGQPRKSSAWQYSQTVKNPCG